MSLAPHGLGALLQHRMRGVHHPSGLELPERIDSNCLAPGRQDVTKALLVDSSGHALPNCCFLKEERACGHYAYFMGKK